MEIQIANEGSRKCGTCTLCCKLVPVLSIGKKANERCKHQRFTGCSIYKTRPSDCQVWSCQWLVDPGVAKFPMHRPDRAHYVIDPMPTTIIIEQDGKRLESHAVQIWMDPDYPDAHRDPGLRAWLEHIGKTDGIPALIRTSDLLGMVLIPPSLTGQGWLELGSEPGRTPEEMKRLMEEAR